MDAVNESLLAALREFANADVLYNAAVAERLGVSVVDLRCLSHLDAHGPVTAGRLADWAGLTSGAITGVVSRLVAAGLVRRDQDPDDARRVRIVPIAENRGQVEQLMLPLGEQLAQVVSQLSADEKAALTRFVAAASHTTAREARRIRYVGE